MQRNTVVSRDGIVELMITNNIILGNLNKNIKSSIKLRLHDVHSNMNLDSFLIHGFQTWNFLLQLT